MSGGGDGCRFAVAEVATKALLVGDRIEVCQLELDEVGVRQRGRRREVWTAWVTSFDDVVKDVEAEAG
jgi:hypothetical protein